MRRGAGGADVALDGRRMWPLWPWFVAFYAINVFDLTASLWEITHHLAREGNPIAATIIIRWGLAGLADVHVLIWLLMGVAFWLLARLYYLGIWPRVVYVSTVLIAVVACAGPLSALLVLLTGGRL